MRASRRNSGASSAQRHASGGPSSSSRVPAMAIAARSSRGPSSPAPQKHERHAEREPRRAGLDAVVAGRAALRTRRGHPRASVRTCAGARTTRRTASAHSSAARRPSPAARRAAAAKTSRAHIASPRARDDVPAQMRDSDRDGVVGGERRGLVEQLTVCSPLPAIQAFEAASNSRRPRASSSAREPRRALGRECGRRVGAALARPRGRVGERVGGRVVGSERGLTQVPGALVRVARRRRAPGPVRRARRGARPGSAALCTAERTSGWRNSMRPSATATRPAASASCSAATSTPSRPAGARRSAPRSAVDAAAATSSERRASSESRETRPANARSTVVAIGSGSFDEAAGNALGLAGELDQRERIAAGRAEQALRAALGHGLVALARQQRLGGTEVEAGRARARAGRRRPAASSSSERTPTMIATGSASKPARGEQDGLGGRLVEPVGIVDEDAERLILRQPRPGCRASPRRSRAARR